MLVLFILQFLQLNLIVYILIKSASLLLNSLLLILILVAISVIIKLFILPWRRRNYIKKLFLTVIIIILIFFIYSTDNFTFWRFFEKLNFINPNYKILIRIVIRFCNIFIFRQLRNILLIIIFLRLIWNS